MGRVLSKSNSHHPTPKHMVNWGYDSQLSKEKTVIYNLSILVKKNYQVCTNSAVWDTANGLTLKDTDDSV